MKFFSRYNKTVLLIILLTLISAIFHFYNYNWGAPYYFHPDERNIASAVTQLKWPEQMNPHFFAYGALPIYTIFFTGIVIHHLPGLQNNTLTNLSFSEAIIIGRFYSALLSTLMIPLLFLVGRKIKNDFVGIIASTLAVGSTGLIQFSHFGTFEIWLTFFTLLLFYTILLLIKEMRLKYFTFASLWCGILLSIKITSIVLLPIPLFVLILHLWKSRKRATTIFHFLTYIFFLICITATVFIISNPYVLLDNTAFLASMEYESSVGFNTLPVFYTQGFYDTIPVLYQLLHIYPFLLNPIVTVFFLVSFIVVVLKTIKQKKLNEFILLLFFVVLFISQAFLFIKWTRYMVPTLPFIYLLIGIAVTYLHTKN